MNIDNVIAQLKLLVPVFNGNVAGAAAYGKAVQDQVWLGRVANAPLQLPAAYVIPLDDEAVPNASQSGFYQIVTERIGVIVDFDNASDRRGQSASAQLLTVRYAIYKALLNWRPDWDPLAATNTQNRESHGIYYAGGRVIEFDRARLFYQFDFALETTLTELDGWQQPTAPFIDIREYVTDQISGETLVVGDTPLPQ